MDGSPDALLRLFVAIELPQAWKDALAELSAELRERLSRDATGQAIKVRWVKPEAFHLTLKFLGETPAARLPAIETALQNASLVIGFRLALGRIGSFSDRRGPRVIWASIGEPEADGSLRLFKLVEQIETWLEWAGVPRQRKLQTPHLTLARLPDRLTPEQARHLAALTELQPPGLAPFTVESISLMLSRLGQGGAVHECLQRFPLQPPA